MKADRKMAMVVNYVHMDDEDEKDATYWLSKTPADRLAEVCRLRKNYFTWSDGSFPQTIAKIISQRKNDI